MRILALLGILSTAYLLVITKRMPALVRSFRYQSFFLFLATLLVAVDSGSLELYAVAALLFIFKVWVIPHYLFRIGREIKVKEDLGLFLNPQLSLLWSLGFTYLSWIFACKLIPGSSLGQQMVLATAFLTVITGLFLMMLRMSALAQVVGILVMENGLFLLAAAVSGGMPFFVEIAIFLDIFVSVIIMGFFLYRINKLFTHIDVNKLSSLRG